MLKLQGPPHTDKYHRLVRCSASARPHLCSHLHLSLKGQYENPYKRSGQRELNNSEFRLCKTSYKAIVIPRVQTPGPQRPSSRRNEQNGPQASRSARNQINLISTSDTPSSILKRSEQAFSHNHDLAELESQFSSAVAVSVPSTVPDGLNDLNSRPQDTSDSDVQIV